YFGPKHSGSVSIWLAVPAVIVVVATIAFSAPYLNTAHLEPRHTNLGTVWVQFVGVILALSGVEAIANLTGVMKLDADATPSAPVRDSSRHSRVYTPLASWAPFHSILVRAHSTSGSVCECTNT